MQEIDKEDNKLGGRRQTSMRKIEINTEKICETGSDIVKVKENTEERGERGGKCLTSCMDAIDINDQ